MKKNKLKKQLKKQHEYSKYLKDKLIEKILQNYKLTIAYHLQLETLNNNIEGYKAALNTIRELVDKDCERNTRALIKCIRKLVEDNKPKEEQAIIEQPSTTEGYWRVTQVVSKLHIYHIPISVCKTEEEAENLVNNNNAINYIVEDINSYHQIDNVKFIKD